MQDCTGVASTTEKKHGGATLEIESVVMCPIGEGNSATKHERGHKMHATRGHLYPTFYRYSPDFGGHNELIATNPTMKKKRKPLSGQNIFIGS